MPQYCCQTCNLNLKSSADFKILITKNYTKIQHYLEAKCNQNFLILEPKTEITDDIQFLNISTIKTEVNQEEEREQISTHPEKIPCPSCSKMLTKNGLQQHLLRFHGADSNNSFECDSCGEKYSSRISLKRHIMKKHVIKVRDAKKPDHVCEFCGAVFKEKRTYDYHRRSKHTFEKPFNCKECNKSFLTSSYLTEHTKVFHKLGDPVVCEICSAPFKSMNRLKLHKKRTHVEKTFACPYEECNKKFKIGYHLKNHVAIHTGDLKSFSCQTCSATYNRP